MIAGTGLGADTEQKKKRRIRSLNTLSAIRKEIARLYAEAKDAGTDASTVTYYRALCYILNAAAQVRKDESLGDIEKRLALLEKG